jgi:hypothetical protein
MISRCVILIYSTIWAQQTRETQWLAGDLRRDERLHAILITFCQNVHFTLGPRPLAAGYMSVFVSE